MAFVESYQVVSQCIREAVSLTMSCQGQPEHPRWLHACRVLLQAI